MSSVAIVVVCFAFAVLVVWFSVVNALCIPMGFGFHKAMCLLIMAGLCQGRFGVWVCVPS